MARDRYSAQPTIKVFVPLGRKKNDSRKVCLKDQMAQATRRPDHLLLTRVIVSKLVQLKIEKDHST